MYKHSILAKMCVSSHKEVNVPNSNTDTHHISAYKRQPKFLKARKISKED